jgi:hypothetical protein
MDKSQKKIIFPAEVVNNQDPQMLGRIRAYPLDQNTRAVLEGYSFNPLTDTWGPKDPFVQLPLLPMFFSQVPDVGERVNIIYQNSLYPFQDQYYIQGAYSSPMSLPFENILAANKYTSLGDRVLSTLSIKNKDGTYKNVKSYGVFPEPGDNALLGRGAADVIVRRNSVILRAGKTKRFDTNKLPIANTNRAFVQLSNFDSSIKSKRTQTFIKLGTANQQIKKLVEWEVQNLENQQNAFTGSIRLYSLKPVNKTLSDNIDYDSNLEDVKFLEYYQNFIGFSFERTIKLINDFIIGVNNGQIPNGPIVENQFPFIYRPNITARKILRDISTTANAVIFTNASRIANSITLNPGLGRQAIKYAIVRSKGEVGKPIKVDLEDVVPKEVVADYGTFLASGADTVYLLSHKSNKPVDLEGTIYGITQQDIIDKVLPFTSSMVRGEELIELLNLIVRFLVAHVHPVPGTPPVPVATDGTQSTQILFELQNAVNKILNPNIRIN